MAIDELLKELLAEFGPSGAAKSRHYPFWHLATDGHGALWNLSGPLAIVTRPAGATPSLGELREHRIKAGFPADVDEALLMGRGMTASPTRSPAMPRMS